MAIKSGNMSWSRHVACIGETRNAYKILARKPEEKRPLGRRRHRSESNVETDVIAKGCVGVNWIQPNRGRFVSILYLTNLWAP
jgi:hypothetical protein